MSQSACWCLRTHPCSCRTGRQKAVSEALMQGQDSRSCAGANFVSSEQRSTDPGLCWGNLASCLRGLVLSLLSTGEGWIQCWALQDTTGMD